MKKDFYVECYPVWYSEDEEAISVSIRVSGVYDTSEAIEKAEDFMENSSDCTYFEVENCSRFSGEETDFVIEV